MVEDTGIRSVQLSIVLGAGGGTAVWKQKQDWRASALLVPRDGAISLLLMGKLHASIANNFGVSSQLLRWRINQTGIIRQLSAISRKQELGQL